MERLSLARPMAGESFPWDDNSAIAELPEIYLAALSRNSSEDQTYCDEFSMQCSNSSTQKYFSSMYCLLSKGLLI